MTDRPADERGEDTGTQPDGSRPLWLTPAVVEAVPLREPPTDVAARRRVRRDAGLDSDGLDYPRQRLWLIAVLPAAVLALLCLAAFIVSGAVIMGVATVAAVAAAGAATGYVVADPLRMSTSERRALVADRSWHSQQTWTGDLAETPERLQLDRAQRAVTRLVRAPAWSSPTLEEHRLRVDLKAELDDIDRQAHEVAAARVGSTARATAQSPGVTAAAQSGLKDRVEALSAYADAVAAVEPGSDAFGPGPALDDGPARRALTATVRDEFATDRWGQLLRELPLAAPAPESVRRADPS